MTTFRQEEYESFLLEGHKPATDVKVTENVTNHPDMFTDKELENVTAVFRSLETGLRGGTISPDDLSRAMKMLGLNPSDQDMVDIPNRIAKNGLIYFPEFCQLVLENLREDRIGEEEFRRNMFKILCGTDPFPTDFRAKKYRLDKHWITKADFVAIMKNLPVEVSDQDIEEMFEFADKNKDGKLSYKEFKVMINPPLPPSTPKPHITDIGMNPQVFSPVVSKEPPSNFASPLLPSKSSLHSSLMSITSTSTHHSRKTSCSTKTEKSDFV